MKSFSVFHHVLAVSLLCAKPCAGCWGTEGEKEREMEKDATVPVIRAHSLPHLSNMSFPAFVTALL